MPERTKSYVNAHELRSLLEQAPDAYFLHNFEGQIIDANLRACDSLGYAREELLSLSILDIEQDFDVASAQAVWSAMVPGKSVTLNGRHRRHDGTHFQVEARLSVCVVGEERVYLGLVRDLTEREVAENELRISAQRYQTLFNSIDEGFCVIQMIFDDSGQPVDYRFLEVNPAFEQHVGILEAAGKTIVELVPNIERHWIEIYGRVATTGQSVRFREYSPSLQGRSFDVYAFRFGSEGSAQVAILFANVTERVKAEQALKNTERLALLGRLAGVISHEINNPLTAIQNLIYLADMVDDPASVREYLRMAQEEVASAARIVANTLRFTRRTEDATREKISDIIDSALTLLEGKRKSAGLSISRIYGVEDEVLCLSLELRQVFANLLSNAFDATQRGGNVSVRVRNSSRWASGQPCVRVTLADNGTGMTAETQKHLFEALYTTKGANGTGLGLWVSSEILARHGVKVQYKSRTEGRRRGTVFMLCFPRDAVRQLVDPAVPVGVVAPSPASEHAASFKQSGKIPASAP